MTDPRRDLFAPPGRRGFTGFSRPGPRGGLVALLTPDLITGLHGTLAGEFRTRRSGAAM